MAGWHVLLDHTTQSQRQLKAIIETSHVPDVSRLRQQFIRHHHHCYLPLSSLTITHPTIEVDVEFGWVVYMHGSLLLTFQHLSKQH